MYPRKLGPVKFATAVVFVLIVSLPRSVDAASQSSWPGAVHDQTRTGQADVLGPVASNPTVRWTRRLEGVVTPGPALLADGTVLAASNGGVLHALDPSTGKDRWRFDGRGSYGNDLSTTPAVLPDGRILWPGPNSRLFVLSSKGKLLQQVQFDQFVLSPAVTNDGRVAYVQDSGGSLRAYDIAAKLTQRWSIAVGTSYSSPAISPDGTIVTASSRDVISIRDEKVSARINWKYNVPDIIEVSPAIAPDGAIVIGTNDDFEYALNSDGTRRWKYNRNSMSYSSAAVTADGRAVFGDHRGRMTTVDVKTGEELAVAQGEPTPSKSRSVGVWTSPAIDAVGNVYFGTRLGHVYGFTKAGVRLWDIDTHDTVDSYPALGPDGTLYIGSSNGLLYAIAGRGSTTG